MATSLLQAGRYRPLLVLPLAAGVAAAWAVGLTRPEPLAGLRALDGPALLVAGSPC